MKNNISRVITGAILTAALAMSAGCGVGDPGATGTNTGSTGGTSASQITYAIPQNPNGTFNPLFYASDYDRNIVFNVYSRLVTVDKDSKFQPSLAESYEESPDGKTLTFHLRKGVKWHDGEPFTADDVVYTYASAANKDYPKDPLQLSTKLVGYEDYHAGKSDQIGVKALDDYTVEFDFAEPYPAALSYLADYPVLAKHIWEKEPISNWDKATDLLRNPVGTGAYKFKEFVDGQYVTLEANPDYFGGEPKTKKLIFKVVTAENLQAALSNNEVNIAEISDWNDKELEAYKNAGGEIVERTGISGSYLTLDTKNEKTGDQKVRQAIATAIDRKGIIKSVLYGHADVINAMATPDDPNLPSDLNTYDYSPEKAKELLKEAGWTDTDGDGIVDKDGEKFTFKIEYSVNSKITGLVAPIIQKNLQDVGIEVSLASQDFNSVLALLLDETQHYDGILIGASKRPWKFADDEWWARWEGPQITGTNEESFGASISEYMKAENEAVPYVWLYMPNKGYVVKGVKNFDPFTYDTFGTITQWTVA